MSLNLWVIGLPIIAIVFYLFAHTWCVHDKVHLRLQVSRDEKFGFSGLAQCVVRGNSLAPFHSIFAVVYSSISILSEFHLSSPSIFFKSTQLGRKSSSRYTTLTIFVKLMVFLVESPVIALEPSLTVIVGTPLW